MVNQLKLHSLYAKEPLEKFLNLRINNNTIHSAALDASLTTIIYQSAVASSSVISAISLSSLNSRNPDIKHFNEHKGPLQDLVFSPFDDEVFASCSDDGLIKVWSVDSKNSRASLSGHTKRVTCCRFNPTVENILTSGSLDKFVHVWDIQDVNYVNKISLDSHIQDISWNYTGSLIAATTKNKLLFILDPRSPDSIINKTSTFKGARTVKISWLGGNITSDNFLLSTGHQDGSERQAILYDIRNLVEPVNRMTLGRGPGIVFPYWDDSTGLMYLPTRGESLVKVVNIQQQAMNVMLVYRCKEYSKAFGFLPKRGVNVPNNEVMRLYQADSTTSIQPVSFFATFKHIKIDVAPPCFSGKPSITSGDWKQTNIIAEPLLKPLSEAGSEHGILPSDSKTLSLMRTMSNLDPEFEEEILQDKTDLLYYKTTNDVLLDELRTLKFEYEELKAELDNLKLKLKELIPKNFSNSKLDEVEYIKGKLKEYDYIITAYKTFVKNAENS